MERQLTPEDHEWIAANEGEEATHKVSLEYADYTKRVVLRAILPLDFEVPGSFEQVGHIAHYNLKDELLPYKEVIGEKNRVPLHTSIPPFLFPQPPYLSPTLSHSSYDLPYLDLYIYGCNLI